MPQTLEKRVEELERKFTELTDKTSKPNWQATFGFSRGDKDFPELVRLGQEYRRNLN